MKLSNIKLIKILNTYRNVWKAQKDREERLSRLLNRELDELHGLKFEESLVDYKHVSGYDAIQARVRIIEDRLRINRRIERLKRVRRSLVSRGLVRA